ncbi:MAG: helix-turn-helix domain-containing protein [Micrococcales bacterium]|jgi:hypothetical protein|nr:helix-turn-helix domain-containing protein [Actinomycetota bacterium]NCA07830.1 helix-turn-helix domain-containing protein [Micrococcales bacterium]
MSAKSVASVLHHSSHSGTARLVLIGIAWHMSETGHAGAWPSIKRLAVYSGVSERQVIRALAALEESGELDVDRHKGESYGGHRTNRYWINIPCPSDCEGGMYHRNFGDNVPMFEVVDNFDTRDIQGQIR